MKHTKEFQAYFDLLTKDSAVGLLFRIGERLSDAGPLSAAAVKEVAVDIDRYVQPFRMGIPCPRCGAPLYLSDLPQYRSVCYACDENFY